MRDMLLHRVPVELSPGARALLLALMAYGDREWRANVTAGELGSVLGLSRNGVEKRLRELRDYGLVGPASVWGLPGGGRAAGYPLTCPPVRPEVQAAWDAQEAVSEASRAGDGVPF